jgi:hypothetical protein
MPLELVLRSRKLAADFEAPHPAWEEDSADSGPGTPCAECNDTGILSYHDLPGSYGVEPCRWCALSSFLDGGGK